MSDEISDADYIKTLETNNALLRKLLELETALKLNFKTLFEDERRIHSEFREIMKDRIALEGKGCFVPKDKKDYTEEELIRLYDIR